MCEEKVHRLLSQGVNSLIEGQVRTANTCFFDVLQIDPFSRVAHFNYALTSRILGRRKRALDHSRFATELEEPLAAAHALYGVHLQLIEQTDQALVQYNRALSIDPTHAIARLYRSLCLAQKGETSQAIADLEYCLHIPNSHLPKLLEERINGLIFDLRSAPQRGRPSSLCGVNLVSEILLPSYQIERAKSVPTQAITMPLIAPSSNAAEIPKHPTIANYRTMSGQSIRREINTLGAARMISGAQEIVVLSGAGLSSASGLATRKQLWERFNRDDAVSVYGFEENPLMLWAVLREFLGEGHHEPNLAHEVLASLPQLKAILTQNVDSLHQLARLRRSDGGVNYPVIELHGTLQRIICHSCGKEANGSAFEFISRNRLPPKCSRCSGVLRPDVVLFGEWVPPLLLEQACSFAKSCDLLIVVGCAMDVAPVSEIPRLAASHGVPILEIKRQPSRISDALGTHLLRGDAVEVLGQVYTHLIEMNPNCYAPLVPRPSSPTTRSEIRGIVPVVAPSFGESVESATVSRRLVAPGAIVKEGDPLYEVETDKVTVEILSPVSGTVEQYDISELQTIAPGELVALIKMHGPFKQSARHDSPANNPLLDDLGEARDVLRDWFRSLRAASWLVPDSALAGCENSAVEWVKMHVDEHFGALASYLGEIEAPIPPPVFLTHDLCELIKHWDSAWAPPSPTAPAVQHWKSLISQAAPKLTSALKGKPPGYDNITKTCDSLAATTRRMIGLSKEQIHGAALGSIKPLIWNSPIDKLATFITWWLAAYGQKTLGSCPWVSILAIWQRGAWPLILPNGELWVWVPHYLENTAMPCPSQPDLHEWPVSTSNFDQFEWQRSGAIVGLDTPPFDITRKRRNQSSR